MIVYIVYNYFSKSKRWSAISKQWSNAYIINGFLSTKLTGMLKQSHFPRTVFKQQNIKT
jgi:hypothetical protein